MGRIKARCTDPSDDSRPNNKSQTSQQYSTSTPPTSRLGFRLLGYKRSRLGDGDFESANSRGSFAAVVEDLDEEDDVTDCLLRREDQREGARGKEKRKEKERNDEREGIEGDGERTR